MINSLKSSRGFITLTITLIIIILVTILSLMTGRMLMNEQRTASNKLRYEEAANAAQAGIDAALARLSLDNEFRASFTNDSSAPFYQVAFGSDTAIQAGEGTLPVVSITAVGTSGYSADAANADEAEAKVTVQQKAVIGRVISGTPDAPLTVDASMAAGGNFTVAANPNGGGPGVPLSIWSEGNVDLTSGSISTCSLQYYELDACNSDTYSDSQSDTKGSDILDNDPDFPDNLLQYIFGVTSIDKLEYKLNQLGRTVLTPGDCNDFNENSHGLYIVKGTSSTSTCSIKGVTGRKDNPVVLVLWNTNLDMNAGAELYGIIYSYADTSGYEMKLNGGATTYGAIIADENVLVKAATGTYNAVYDAEVLSNIASGGDFLYIARVSGSWRDGE